MIIAQLRLTDALCKYLVGGDAPPTGYFLFASCARAILLVAVAVMRVVRAALSFEVTLCPAPRALSRVSWLRASLGSLYGVLRRCGSVGDMWVPCGRESA